MRYRFFRIPVNDPDAATDELNRFSASHRIVTTERQFVADGGNSCWSLCVAYADQSESSTQEKRGRVDYREVLSPEDFIVFAKLRDLRKQIAQAEGVPVYALFSNDQLAGMVTNRVDSAAGLSQIDGVGAGRIEKYGARFLEVLLAEQGHQNLHDRHSHETDNHSD